MAKSDELMLQEQTATDRPTAPMPSNPTSAEGGLVQKNQALDAALDTVPADRLRGIIKNLCLISDSAEKHISQLLLAPEENDNPTSKRKHSAADENVEASNSSKRTKGQYAICVQCDGDFELALNDGKDCRYHPGQSTIQPCIVISGLINSPERVGEGDTGEDPDIWDPFHEGLHISFIGLKDGIPQSFQWTCCGRAGHRGGCKRGPHRKDDKEADEESDENVPSDTDSEDGEDRNNSKDGGE
ncbi:hypothetical protein EPUS_07459 [Endocarpon pusillum Z07020]|uniref:Uncharacterized protein n=1 Tax=Endocarpon pusillum (strain Z07020 / HMAS-L-300199) TaxID=1263415 RepID=U1HS45_ENDPU|nr:uncharacterized protein EPUS_07459 [Endocarpon pusillum Z07020]ERF71989.1 hypothetical protein EPUS_07459 [Endocarpon pusillum Z07020]